MNEEQDSRMERRVFFRRENDSESSQTGGGSPEKRGASSFIRNNLEHEKMGFGFYKTLAAVVLGLIGGGIVIGFMAGNVTRNEISKVVYEVVPNVRMDQDGPTLRRLLYDYESDIKECKKYDTRLSDVECFLRKGKECK